MRILLMAFSISILTLSASAQSKSEFKYPEDIADSSRKSFAKEFKQGKILYAISCGKCHNKSANGKELIPDFSLPQLMDYEMRIYPQHVEELPDSKLADGELQKIIVFLRYKNRSGYTIHPAPKQ
ncbi:MAG: hypothetical protein H7Y27_03840 [Gemmatimonadaceae bacterium]|nr:hypothetical protein [Chitinophagaceae bacterium]